MSTLLDQIENAIDACHINKETILASWKDIVEIESYTHDPESINQVSHYLKERLESLGFEAKEYLMEQAGPVLVAEIGSGDISEGIILSGHMDTVYKTGTLADFPFRLDDDLVRGPGALDMKGGLNLIYYIVQMLQQLNYEQRIKVIICGDEEHGHTSSNAVNIMLEESKGYKCAFNLETGLVNNAITVARKGRIGYEINAYGKSAHAGADFNAGISAITALSKVILDIDALNQKYETATFCVGTVEGGTMMNAVPDFAKATVDIRYIDRADVDKIFKDIESICQSPADNGARIEADLVSNFPSFMDKDNQSFYELVNATSQELGFGPMGTAHLGGSSDAAHLSETGLPVLCSMGVRGEWNHTPREYAESDSALERIKLITASILNLQGKTL